MGKIFFLVLLVFFSFILRTGAQTVLPLKVSADKRYPTDQRNTPCYLSVQENKLTLLLRGNVKEYYYSIRDPEHRMVK